MVENNPEKENNTILKVYKHGYKLGDNIIRYADVIVNKIE
jgi:molecular chaperone GrpE (heat shock protein)